MEWSGLNQKKDSGFSVLVAGLVFLRIFTLQKRGERKRGVVCARVDALIPALLSPSRHQLFSFLFNIIFVFLISVELLTCHLFTGKREATEEGQVGNETVYESRWFDS